MQPFTSLALALSLLLAAPAEASTAAGTEPFRRQEAPPHVDQEDGPVSAVPS